MLIDKDDNSFFDNKTLASVREILENYNSGDGDIQDVKSYWQGMSACKFDGEQLESFGLNVGDNMPNSKEMGEFRWLLLAKIEGKFSKSDYVEDKKEREKIMAISGDDRYEMAARYVELEKTCGSRFTAIGEMDRQFRELDLIKGHKDRNKSSQKTVARGLAAFRSNISDSHNHKNMKKARNFWFADDKSHDPLFFEDIEKGIVYFKYYDFLESGPSLGGDLAAGALLAKQGISWLWDFVSKSDAERNDIARLETEKLDNALFAVQQIAIQNFGKIKLQGGSKYLDNAIRVAAQNGTWKNIAEIKCDAGKYKNMSSNELMRKLENEVINQSGIASVWNKFSDRKLKPGISISEAEREIRSVFTGVMQYFATLEEYSKIDGKNAEIFKTIMARRGDLLKNPDFRPGHFMDMMIESMKNDAPGATFIDDLSSMLDIADKMGFLQQIRQKAENKAESRDTIEPVKEKSGKPVEGKIAAPCGVMLASVLGVPAGSGAEETRKAFMNFAKELAAYKDVKTRSNDKVYAQRIDSVMKDIGNILRDQDAFHANPGSLLSKAEASGLNMADNQSGKTVPATLSAEISSIISDMRVDKATSINPLNFDSAMSEVPRDMHEVFSISGWRESMAEPGQKPMVAEVNGAVYTWHARKTAHGNALFMHENGGGQPMAVALNGKVWANYKNAGLQDRELSNILKQTFRNNQTQSLSDDGTLYAEQSQKAPSSKQNQETEQAPRETQAM